MTGYPGECRDRPAAGFGMPPSTCAWIAVPNQAKLPEWLAVLAVAGIPYAVAWQTDAWFITVAAADETAARRLIDTHEVEHRDWPAVVSPSPPAEAPWSGNLWAGFWGAYALGLFYLWQGPYRIANALLRAGGARRSAIQAGEWWRSVTALMIHADVGHLTSNLLFLFGFAAVAARLYGAGIAWLLIVLAGGLGNTLVALTATRDGVGVGASTACFGALGLLVVHGLREAMQAEGSWRQRWRRAWLPLMGGLAMLSLTGAAPGTDVMAHLAGFLAGMLMGTPFVIGERRQPLPAPAQTVALILAIGLVGMAWWLAV